MGIENNNRIISDDFIFMRSLALSLKMLLGRSMSSQVNIN